MGCQFHYETVFLFESYNETPIPTYGYLIKFWFIPKRLYMNKFNLICLILVLLIIKPALASEISIEVSPSQNIILESSDWISANGSFYPGATPMNIYSHKTKQELQLFFEDLYIPKDTLKSRLPKNCSHLNSDSNTFCKSESKEENKQNISYTSVFPLKQKNLVRVRTVFLVGKKQDLSAIIPVQRAPAGKVSN